MNTCPHSTYRTQPRKRMWANRSKTLRRRHGQHLSSSGQIQRQRASRDVACRCPWKGEAPPSGINENGTAERQCQAPWMQSVAHQACWKVQGQAEKALLAEGCSTSPNQRCLLAPVVEHGLPPLLLEVLQAWRETQLAAAALGNASLHSSSAPPVRPASNNAFSAYP